MKPDIVGNTTRYEIKPMSPLVQADSDTQMARLKTHRLPTHLVFYSPWVLDLLICDIKVKNSGFYFMVRWKFTMWGN